MFRLALGIVFVLLLGLHSLLPETAQTVDGTRHLFAAAWTQWFFVGLTALVLIGFAEIARRFMKDRILSVICWLMIPLFGFTLVPGLWDNRVEITKDHLIHRRGYPHARYNADIPWADVRKVTEIKKEYPGSFWGTKYILRYQVELKDGTTFELPSSPPLIAAQQQIDRVIAERKIPFTVQTIPVAKEQ